MKILGIIKKIIIGIMGIIFFAFAISMTILLLNYNDYGITQLGNTSVLIIRDRISSDKYNKGDIVLVETLKFKDAKIGDEVFVYKVDKKGSVNIDFGTVGKIHEKEEAVTFENGDTYSIDVVVGKASKVYPKIGTYLAIVESQWGFLFIVLVPSFLIFVYEIYALIVEVKYGKDEEIVQPIPNPNNV